MCVGLNRRTPVCACGVAIWWHAHAILWHTGDGQHSRDNHWATLGVRKVATGSRPSRNGGLRSLSSDLSNQIVLIRRGMPRLSTLLSYQIIFCTLSLSLSLGPGCGHGGSIYKRSN